MQAASGRRTARCAGMLAVGWVPAGRTLYVTAWQWCNTKLVLMLCLSNPGGQLAGLLLLLLLLLAECPQKRQ